MPFSSSATITFVKRQVRLTKSAWSGARLADGYPLLFGALLDEARGLSPDAAPDYRAWEEGFSALVNTALLTPGDVSISFSPSSDPESASDSETDLSSSLPLKFTDDSPVRAGQLVYTRLLPRITISGYTTTRSPPDTWFPDATLADDAWVTTFFPAVVLAASRDGFGRWCVDLAALSSAPPTDADARTVRIGADMVSGAGWPDRDVWCTVHRRTEFLWTPDQVRCRPFTVRAAALTSS